LILTTGIICLSIGSVREYVTYPDPRIKRICYIFSGNAIAGLGFHDGKIKAPPSAWLMWLF
jgi:hypothetical protein